MNNLYLNNKNHKNFISAIKSWSAWPDMTIYNIGDSTISISDINFPVFNNILQNSSSKITDDCLRNILTIVCKQNVATIWWIESETKSNRLIDRLGDNGFTCHDIVIGMAINLSTISNSVSLPNFTVERISRSSSLRQWTNLLISNFNYPQFVVKPWFDLFKSIGFTDNQPWRHYLGLISGMPIATVSVILSSGVIGLAHVSVIPEYREKGIGRILISKVLFEAKKLGFDTAVLYSTTQSLGFYKTIGFKEISNFSLVIRDQFDACFK